MTYPARFLDLPIRRKLLIMTLASSASALVLASGGFLTWDIVQFRSEIRGDLSAQARIVAENSWAPLTFRDERTARETLAVLELRPRVERGCLYTPDGQLFSKYERDATTPCSAAVPVAHGFGWNQFDVVESVTDGRSRLGTLYISRELGDVYSRLRIGAATVVGVLLLAIAASFLISARMQRIIASPLLQLADTARAVSTTRDYSLRASAVSTDETGVVITAFNDMLDRIAERTTELSKANLELEREVEERRRVEHERIAALERERDANRLKDEFLATLSHELRTPLNAVLGWARVLRSARIEPVTQMRALESIERNAQAQARLIEDILDVSRIVTGKLRLQIRDVDLTAIIDAAVEVIQPAATAKRLHIAMEIAVRPAMTMADPDRLQQVVWNLLSNAVKFTPPEGRLFVRLERRDGYYLTIRDTGPGIEPKFLPFVFEPFRQADGTASREHGGLGIGLAIAKQLVELHGGTIEVYSEGRGAGARFEVHLPSVVISPVQEVLPDQPVQPHTEPSVNSSLLRDLRVLIVDDEEDARALLELALVQYGAHVTAASSVQQALTELEGGLPDVILSDIGMPHQDGYALIRELRSRPEPQGGSIPAVAITAYASKADVHLAEAAGYQAHIAKPYDPAHVASVIARLGRSARTGPA